MSIESLSVLQFRNITSLSLHLSPACNIFIGDNGSGKTSILEAIHMLGLSRSFRTHLTRRIIQDEADNFCVSALLDDKSRVGVEKHRNSLTRIRINGENQDSATALAELLPLQLINPDSYRLLESGPKERRQFLDWGVFHVEHRFLSEWRDYQKALKQRNAAIKMMQAQSQIQIWDQVLVDSAEQIDEMRKEFMREFVPIFKRLLGSLLDYPIEITYKRGWSDDSCLLDLLSEGIGRDQQQGYTYYGAHRADLKLTIEKTPAVDILSRGQQKLLVCALRLAQGLTLRQVNEKQCIYLIDDLAAELDQHSFTKISQTLAKMEAQVLVTGVDRAALKPLEREMTCKLFHVEHGLVSELGEEAVCLDLQE